MEIISEVGQPEKKKGKKKKKKIITKIVETQGGKGNLLKILLLINILNFSNLLNNKNPENNSDLQCNYHQDNKESLIKEINFLNWF